MSFKNATSALWQLYENLPLALPTAYEGKPFDPPEPQSPGADWVQVNNLPAITEPVTLGEGGEDQEDGIFQLVFYIPQGEGWGRLVDYAETIHQQVIPGQRYAYDNQIVHIASVQRSNVIRSGPWMTITVSINWFARYTRPQI